MPTIPEQITAIETAIKKVEMLQGEYTRKSEPKSIKDLMSDLVHHKDVLKEYRLKHRGGESFKVCK